MVVVLRRNELVASDAIALQQMDEYGCIPERARWQLELVERLGYESLVDGNHWHQRSRSSALVHLRVTPIEHFRWKLVRRHRSQQWKFRWSIRSRTRRNHHRVLHCGKSAPGRSCWYDQRWRRRRWRLQRTLGEQGEYMVRVMFGNLL